MGGDGSTPNGRRGAGDDGTGATTTVRFGLDGEAYEIDLSAHNAEALRQAFAPYVRAGRKVGRSTRRR